MLFLVHEKDKGQSGETTVSRRRRGVLRQSVQIVREKLIVSIRCNISCCSFKHKTYLD